jgi:hypothetical protein
MASSNEISSKFFIREFGYEEIFSDRHQKSKEGTAFLTICKIGRRWIDFIEHVDTWTFDAYVTIQGLPLGPLSTYSRFDDTFPLLV